MSASLPKKPRASPQDDDETFVISMVAYIYGFIAWLAVMALVAIVWGLIVAGPPIVDGLAHMAGR